MKKTIYLFLSFGLLGCLLFVTANILKAQTLNDYQNTPKTLYAWNSVSRKKIDGVSNWLLLLKNENQSFDKLIEFCNIHGFNAINLFVGSVQWEWQDYFRHHILPMEAYLKDNIAKANNNGIKVFALYYLNDEPNNLKDYQLIEDFVASVDSFNNRYPAASFVGISGDQEPWQKEVYQDYLQTNKIIKNKINQLNSDLITSVALKPLWVDQLYDGYKGEKAFFEYVLEDVDQAALMAYYDDVDMIKNIALPVLAYANNTGQKIDIILETGWINVLDPNTFYEEIKKDKKGFLDFVFNLNQDLKVNDSFSNIVIHDFTQFFKSLYLKEPYYFDKDINDLFLN